MNLSKKLILLGLVSIFIITSMATFSFASEEKDYINRTLKLIDEEKYNEAVKELEEALAIVKSKADLELINLFLCEEDPLMFGIYNPRENVIFSQEDTIFIYAEPKNYTYKEIQKGLYEIHFKAEIYLLDSSDNVLTGDINFLDFPLTSRAKNSEIFISSELPVKNLSLPPGDYKFRFILKDALSQKTTEATIEFTVTEKSTIESTSVKQGIIKSWKGTGIKTTEPFTITTKPWKINYSGGGGLLQIYVYDMDNNLIDLFQSTDNKGDTSFVYKTGKFYLNISGMDKWEVKILK